jgi:hypothetical protein
MFIQSRIVQSRDMRACASRLDNNAYHQDSQGLSKRPKNPCANVHEAQLLEESCYYHNHIRAIHGEILCIHMRIFITCVYTSSSYPPLLKSSRAQRHTAWRPSSSRMSQEPSSQSGSPASCYPRAWYLQHSRSSHPRSSPTTAFPSAYFSTRNTPSLPLW